MNGNQRHDLMLNSSLNHEFMNLVDKGCQIVEQRPLPRIQNVLVLYASLELSNQVETKVVDQNLRH